MKIAVLIPCYNEALTIEKVVKDFSHQLPDASIYVYDNNSTDNTYEIAKAMNVTVVKEPRQGKGNVVRSMLKDIDADIYILVDGDNTYPAENVHAMMKPVLEKDADIVIGDRLSNGSYLSENKRAFHNFGNSLVKRLINRLFKSDLKDIMSGYRVLNRYFAKTFPILSKGFEIETEMSIYSLHNSYKLIEIPIDYRDRPDGSVSKLNTYKDGFKVIKIIFWLFKDFKPLIFFSYASLFLVLLGVAIGIPVILEFLRTGYIERIPSAILSAALEIIAMLLFACGLILDTTVKHQKTLHEQLSILFTVMDKRDNH
ncbi:MAG: glycosyltransferase family 2 protein [Chitinophagaceae bacterium]